MAAANDARRIETLTKEAFALTEALADIDKKIEADLDRENGKLAGWIESNAAAKWAIDKIETKSLEEILGAILKLAKVSTTIIDILPGVVIDVFQAEKGANSRAAYLDDRPLLARDYDRKKDRLQQIYIELFILMPPRPDAFNSRCATESCWQARP